MRKIVRINRIDYLTHEKPHMVEVTFNQLIESFPGGESHAVIRTIIPKELFMKLNNTDTLISYLEDADTVENNILEISKKR